MKLTGIAARLLVIALILFDLCSPLIIRSQLDGNANTAAFEAQLEYERTSSIAAAKATAVREATEVGAILGPDDPATAADPKTGIGDESFWMDAEGTIHVVLVKTAPSVVGKRISKFKTWYEIKIEATAKKRTI